MVRTVRTGELTLPEPNGLPVYHGGMVNCHPPWGTHHGERQNACIPW
jgi:hypothetical protein